MIAIAVIFSIVGLVIIGILVYCYCIKKDVPAMTERQPGGPPGFAPAPPVPGITPDESVADQSQI